MSFSPGWYQDPHDYTKERFFNGGAWTEHVRNDIPEIPLAPWVDPVQHLVTGGVLIDSTPPKSSRSMWLAIAAATVGVIAVTLVGITISMGGLTA